ncbi:MAG TPA: tyrosine--tRNA ligase [Thermoplasmatales archaeon]|nr:tyrosine--tRNA ligase [Thermoplasmatales archaeon]HEX17351.1 tyrosine--tRNA ligase [Thermoplasmatales archaeon]
MKGMERLLSNTVEVVTEEELIKVMGMERKRAYIGFEPSGFAHLGWKICANKIRDFLDCGFDFIILLADWHAYINDKLDGDMEKIRICGRYMEDCFEAMGVSKNKVKFVYASDYISDSKYWELVLKIAKANSIARVKRAMDVMGRKEEEAEKDLSKLFYPVMQVADIFYLDIDVAYGGIDQRHAHMLARDTAKKMRMKKPVALHTPLLPSLQARGRMDPIDMKMSKSKPESMISIHDSEEEVERKIRKAYCPEREVENNPILDIWRYLIFQEFKEVKVERPRRFGGDITLKSFKELEEIFSKGDLHPLDLKNTTSKYINEILQPIRKYFDSHPDNLEFFLKTVK